MILLSGKTINSVPQLMVLFAITGLVMLVCYLVFRLADRISKSMGITGRAVISRLLGIILAALAVQFIIDGVHTAIT